MIDVLVGRLRTSQPRWDVSQARSPRVLDQLFSASSTGSRAGGFAIAICGTPRERV